MEQFQLATLLGGSAFHPIIIKVEVIVDSGISALTIRPKIMDCHLVLEQIIQSA